MLLKLTCLIPLYPLIGSIINGFFGLKIGKKAVGFIACGSMTLSFLTSVLVYVGYLMLPEGQHVYEQVVWTWFGAGDFNVDFPTRSSTQRNFFQLALGKTTAKRALR